VDRAFAAEGNFCFGPRSMEFPDGHIFFVIEDIQDGLLGHISKFHGRLVPIFTAKGDGSIGQNDEMFKDMPAGFHFEEGIPSEHLQVCVLRVKGTGPGVGIVADDEIVFFLSEVLSPEGHIVVPLVMVGFLTDEADDKPRWVFALVACGDGGEDVLKNFGVVEFASDVFVGSRADSVNAEDDRVNSGGEKG